MPYIDNLQSLREKAGLTKASVARAAELTADTITKIEKHQSATRASCVRAIIALNVLHYSKIGYPIDPDAVVTDKSKFASK